MDHAYHLPVYFLMLSFQVTFIRMEREVSGTQGPNTAVSCERGERGWEERGFRATPNPSHSLYFSDVMERISISN